MTTGRITNNQTYGVHLKSAWHQTRISPIRGGRQASRRTTACRYHGFFAKEGEAVAENPVETRTIGFPANATAKSIKSELVKHLETYKSDLEAVAASAKAEEANANAIKVAKELDGLEI